MCIFVKLGHYFQVWVQLILSVTRKMPVSASPQSSSSQLLQAWAGRDNRRREFGLGKKGELRSPLQASQQVWTVLQLVPVWAQPAWRKAKLRRSEHSDWSPLLQRCACSGFRSWAWVDKSVSSSLRGGDRGRRWPGEELLRQVRRWEAAGCGHRGNEAS